MKRLSLKTNVYICDEQEEVIRPTQFATILGEMAGKEIQRGIERRNKSMLDKDIRKQQRYEITQ